MRRRIRTSVEEAYLRGQGKPSRPTQRELWRANAGLPVRLVMGISSEPDEGVSPLGHQLDGMCDEVDQTDPNSRRQMPPIGQTWKPAGYLAVTAENVVVEG